MSFRASLDLRRNNQNNNNNNNNNKTAKEEDNKHTTTDILGPLIKRAGSGRFLSSPKTTLSPKVSKRSIIMQNKQRHRYKGQQREGSVQPIGMRKTRSDTPAQRNDIPEVVRPTKSDDVDHNRREKKLDKYGFIINMDSKGQVYDDVMIEDRIPTFAETKLVERREKKWSNMMQFWDATKRRRKFLSKRLRKGLPDSMRAAVWTALANVPRTIQLNQGKYDELVRTSVENSIPIDDANDGEVVMESPGVVPAQSPSAKSYTPTPLSQSHSFRATQDTIERDIHRTYPRHSMFHEDSDTDEDEGDHPLSKLNDEEVTTIIAELEGGLKSENESNHVMNRRKSLELAKGGQASLRRVLKAYSVYDREVGYCQGMNFIAGMFLTFMSEEEAFWLLVGVMHDPPCRMRGLFLEGMQGTHQVLYVAEKLTHQFLPRLAKHLDQENVHITMYATQWLLTLFTSSFQFDLVTRVWDCFLCEGWKIVYRVMLALLQESQTELMSLRFEDILAYFREIPERTDGNEIMDMALRIPLRRKHLANYEQEWIARQQQSSS